MPNSAIRIRSEPLSSIDLRFETYVVRATSPEPEDLAWVASVLAGGFETVESSAPHAEVVLTVDAAGYDVLLDRGRTAKGPEVEGFARDAQRSMLERWSTDGATSIVRDPLIPGFYRLRRAPRAVEIVVRKRAYGGRMALMQVARELAMDHVVATGGVLVHGAAARFRGGMIVMSGPKGRGKTTLLLSLLEHAGLSYVSNDRCVLRVADSSAIVRGLPTIVSITRTGLDAFPGFRQRLFAVRPDLAVSDTPSLGLGPHQFARLFSSPPSCHGRVSAFLFPQVTDNRRRLVLRRLAPPEALDRFREGLFRAGQRAVLGEVFALQTAADTSSWTMGETAGRWVAANLPCFLVELGGDGPPTAEECRTLLAEICRE